jgi:hypothetical protein
MKQQSLTGILLCFILVTVTTEYCEAQLQRERVQTDEPVSDIFWASSNIGVSTVRNLSAGNLNSTIAHIFGPVTGGIDRFFGLDDGANTRLGLDYGFTDRFSLGIGRMTFNKIVDLRSKYNFLRQSSSGDIPFDLALKLSSGISTLSGAGLEFSDRISYLVSVMAARKFNSFSIQLTPMAAYFNSPSPGNQSQLFGIGILAQYELNERFSINTEYLPVLGKRNNGTHNTLAAALNINTGGHIFQIFFTSSQWHGEQFVMANNRDRFFDGDFRFGFNIHRVFGL